MSQGVITYVLVKYLSLTCMEVSRNRLPHDQWNDTWALTVVLVWTPVLNHFFQDQLSPTDHDNMIKN